MARIHVVVLGALVGCSEPPVVEERVTPVDFVLDDRIVMTPGHTVVHRVPIVREEDSTHPVQLVLTGDSGAGVWVSIDTNNTRENFVTLTVSVGSNAAPQDLAFELAGHLGPYHEAEPFVVSVQLPDRTAATTEEYAPGVTGFAKTTTINGQEIAYEVIDGVAIMDGDIVLGDAALLAARAQLQTFTCNPNFHTDYACSAWTNATIGYTFANNWGDLGENRRMQGIILDAMAEWTKQTGIKFVPRATGEFLQFRDGGGCSSGVGRVVFTGLDSQSISLDNTGCDTKGIVMHEIGHAIGLYHEQQRNDRNNYVHIDLPQVQDLKQGNFFQIGDYGVNRLDYDYTSIMHYPPWAFAKNRTLCEENWNLDGPDDVRTTTGCTIWPADLTTEIGQREVLSERDIYGVYQLYPPIFRITGATDGQRGDRFELVLDYQQGEPGVDRVLWFSNRHGVSIGVGNRIILRAADLAAGTHEITASFRVAGRVLREETITLEFANTMPSVTIVPLNGSTTQPINRTFTVAASINDTESGTCPECTFFWDPQPAGPDYQNFASYAFTSAGPQTITVTVVDGGGAVGTGTLTIDVVDAPPVMTIMNPGGHLTVTNGTRVPLEGYGIDPDTGFISCSRLHWTSTVAADDVAPYQCGGEVTVNGAGIRTITLRDGITNAEATVKITVIDCDPGACPPSVSVHHETPASPYGTHYINRLLPIYMYLRDPEQHPLTYRLFVRRVGSTAEIDLRTGTLTPHSATSWSSEMHHWTPSDNIPDWTNCYSDWHDYDIVIEATDSTGMSASHSIRVTLACELI